MGYAYKLNGCILAGRFVYRLFRMEDAEKLFCSALVYAIGTAFLPLFPSYR